MKVLRPFLFIAGFILLVGLACSINMGDTPAQPSQPDQLDQPVQPAEPEEPEPAQPEPEPAQPEPEPEPTQEPMPTPEPVSREFFTEEFDGDPGWYYELFHGSNSDPKKATYNFDFGRMVFDIDDQDMTAYYLYPDMMYENVRLDINYENRGVNSQQVSLICQYSDDGWYELSVMNDGRWFLYAFSNGYQTMANGASTFVKQGKEVNEYTLICEGNKLTFLINDVEPKGSPWTDRKYALRRGNVGFSVSSFRAIPVKVEIDWFQVSPP
jgi:hypothetical protein